MYQVLFRVPSRHHLIEASQLPTEKYDFSHFPDEETEAQRSIRKECVDHF